VSRPTAPPPPQPQARPTPPSGFPDNVDWERFLSACGTTFTRAFEGVWRASKMVRAWDLAGRPDPWDGTHPDLLAMLHRWAHRVEEFGMVGACGQFPTIMDPRNRHRWLIEDDAGRPPDVFQHVARSLQAHAAGQAPTVPYSPDGDGDGDGDGVGEPDPPTTLMPAGSQVDL
jgi:hypothetical protein